MAVSSQRRSSHVRRVLGALYGALVLLCAAWITHSHLVERSSLREQCLDRMAGVAATLAAQLNGQHVHALLDRYREPGLVIRTTQDARYYVLFDHLRNAAERLELDGPLRILALDSASDQLQVVVTSAHTPTFRAAFPDPGGRLREACSAGARGVMHDPATGRALVYDRLAMPEGTAAALVTVEASITGMNAAARAGLWRNILIALAVFGVVGTLLFTSVGRWLHRAQAHQEALQQRHDDITHSLAYAGRIQRALVPPVTMYHATFDGAFIIDRPKDMVGGDFHWLHRLDAHRSLVATADCTGHGMPGAMMAAIGCSLLNEIVHARPDMDPAGMLGELDRRLVAMLREQGRALAGDGMDIALCRIDREAREILFAGAHRPLYWLHNGQLTVINGDRAPIGGATHRPGRVFTVHRLAYSPGDRIYLLSDGYVDQFGGPHGKRFMSRRLHELLSAHSDLDMAGQRDVLERAFLEWKGDAPQVDDVCMLGIAV